MERIEMYGQDAQLHAALRRRAPQIAASLDVIDAAVLDEILARHKRSAP